MEMEEGNGFSFVFGFGFFDEIGGGVGIFVVFFGNDLVFVYVKRVDDIIV